MTDLLPSITVIAIHVLPAAFALLWAAVTEVAPVRRVMILTAILNILAVSFCFGSLLLADALCDGSAIKGYTGCIYIVIAVAQLALPFYLLVLAVFVIWFVVAVVISARDEIRALRKRRRAG